MQVDLFDVQRRYGEMADEEFALLKRSDLLPEIQALYDRELARRSASPKWIALRSQLESDPHPTWLPLLKKWQDDYNDWLEHATPKRIIVSWLVGVVLAAPPWIVEARNINVYRDIGETAWTVYFLLGMPGFIFATRIDRDHHGSINVEAIANLIFYGFLFLNFLVRGARRREAAS
jgi:hypothetical protein